VPTPHTFLHKLIHRFLCQLTTATEYASAPIQLITQNTLDTTIITSHQGRTSKTAGGNRGPVGYALHRGIRGPGMQGRQKGPPRFDSNVLHRVHLSTDNKMDTKKKKKHSTQSPTMIETAHLYLLLLNQMIHYLMGVI